MNTPSIAAELTLQTDGGGCGAVHARCICFERRSAFGLQLKGAGGSGLQGRAPPNDPCVAVIIVKRIYWGATQSDPRSNTNLAAGPGWY